MTNNKKSYQQFINNKQKKNLPHLLKNINIQIYVYYVNKLKQIIKNQLDLQH